LQKDAEVIDSSVEGQCEFAILNPPPFVTTATV
jgi:hypothetical protein